MDEETDPAGVPDGTGRSDAPASAGGDSDVYAETGEVFEGVVRPEATEAARPPGRVGRAVRVTALVAGVVSMSALAYAVWGAFSGGGAGADGPEDVVEAMAAAASDEDAIAMLGLLAPPEVGTFAELYPDLLEWAAREGIIADEQWLAGVDVEISGLDTEVTYLHSDVAVVELRAGELSITVDPEVADPGHVDRFGLEYSQTVDGTLAQLQDAVREGREGIAESTVGGLFDLSEPDGIYVMTIRHRGRWYLSPFYTVADYARRIADLPQADFTASREDAKAGASSASGVMAGFVDMLNSHRFEDYLEAETIADLGGDRSPLNAFVPPDELGVVLDYAVAYRAWLDRINERDQPENLWQIIDNLGLEIRGEIDIEIDTREQPGPDGAVILYLSSGSITARAEVTVIETGEVQPWEIHASWEGLCSTGYAQIYDDFDDFEVCIDPEDWPGDEDEPFIVVREVDGYWYESYVETGLAYIRLFLDDYLSDVADRAEI